MGSWKPYKIRLRDSESLYDAKGGMQRMKQYKFSVEEIKRLTKNMIVLVDSREKKNSHILDYFRKQKISFQTEKLEYGDYSFMIPAIVAGENIYFHWDCVVERKASLEELSGNLTGERERFEKEFLKAGNDGCKVYLMIEAPAVTLILSGINTARSLRLLPIWHL